MKKFIYISGTILLNLLLIGVILKVGHWPGASILISVSLTLLVVMFFPLALISSYKSEEDKSQLHLYIIAYMTIAIVLLGALFKIMHWPGAGIFLMIGIPLPFILFLPFYIRYHNKIKAKSDKNFFGLLFFMIYMATISSFLALDVSREVYEAYLPQIKNMASQSTVLEQRNDLSYEIIIQRTENESTKNDIELLKKSADDLCKVLKDVEKELIINSSQKNKAFISENIIDYNSIEGLSRKNVFVSLVNPKGDNTKENLIEKKFIVFENAIKNLSDSYELKDLLYNKDKTHSLDFFKNNMYSGQFASKSMVENLSALSFMQNKVRLMEYQILYKIQN